MQSLQLESCVHSTAAAATLAGMTAPAQRTSPISNLATAIPFVFACRGHASEKPELPQALEDSGIRFLGPPAGPMAALGDKIGSTILAQAANVPTIPWSGSGISMDYGTCDGVIPQDIYDAVGCPTFSSNCQVR